jgi:hypothetical protein
MIESRGKLLETKCMEFLPSHGTNNTRLSVQRDYDKMINKIKELKGIIVMGVFINESNGIHRQCAQE